MTRTALLLTTALTAALASAARAQAPNQLPVGGTVVGGAASTSVNGSRLTVNQSSTRAALDWKSFDVGRNATVRFDTPGANAVTLNRVTGPAGSVIAGQVSSNGQLVIINQSGVLVTPSGAIDAQSVVLSAAGITQQGMRAGVATGQFVLDQAARPGAAVTNAGRISVKAAGLAALVAPSVANHGTIAAAFGTVHLAGEAAQVVDLYGDGLLSVDVSRQTVQGGPGGPALVSNDGVIQAQGGRVLLSTAAVDGVVTNLVTAGGTIAADGGTVQLDAASGSARATGQITAHGGQVGVMASETAALLAGSVIDVSAPNGGGVVAVGTTLARARGGPGTPAPRAKHTVVAAGASIDADATTSGRGGTITLLSSEQTDFAGSLSSRGGSFAGDGGLIEVSGDHGLSFAGSVVATAANGALGTLLLDPGDIDVVATGSAAGSAHLNAPATITGASLGAVHASISLVATGGTITIEDNVQLDANVAFRLNAAAINVTSAGSVNAGGLIDFESTGSINVAGTLISRGTALSGDGQGIVLLNGPGGVTIGPAGEGAAPLVQGLHVSIEGGGVLTLNTGTINTPFGTVDLGVSGATSTGVINASQLSSGGSSGVVDLSGGTNAITHLGPFTMSGPASKLLVKSTTSLHVFGAVQADTVSLNAAGLFLEANVTAPTELSLTSPSGLIQTAGTISTGLLSLPSVGGSATLTASHNSVGALGLVRIHALGGSPANFLLTSAAPLQVGQSVSVDDGGTISLAVPALEFLDSGSATALNGVVEIAPNTVTSMTLGGPDSLTSLVINGNDLIAAGTLRLGSAHGSVAGTVVSGASLDSSDVGTTEVDSAGNITLTQPLTASTLLFAAAGSVDAHGAVIQATTVAGAGTIGTGFDLSNAGNTVGALGPITLETGVLSVRTQGPLTVAGAVSLAGAGTVRLHAATAIAIAAPVTAPSGTLDVLTDGIVNSVTVPAPVTQTAPIDVAELDGSVAGTIVLANPGNTIGVLGGLTALNSIRLQSTGTMTVGGAVGEAGLATIDLSAAALAETAGGSVTATRLTSTGGVGGGVTLGAANTIGTIGGFVAGAGLTLDDSGNLTTFTVGAGVQATNARLVAGGTIDVRAQVSLQASGTLDLQAAALTAHAGAASSLTTAPIALVAVAPLAGQGVTLGANTGNAGTLLVTPAFLSAVNAPVLQVGALSDGVAVATAITVRAIDFTALANHPATLLLDTVAGGDVTQAGAASALTVINLGGTIGGNLVLADPGNAIGHLGGLTIAGNGLIADANPTVDGAVQVAAGKTLSLAVGGLHFAGGGTIAASGGTVEIGALAGSTLHWGGTAAGAIDANLDAITASRLRIGTSGAGAGQAATLDLAGLDSARGAATLELVAGTTITEQNAASLTANLLTASLTGAGIVLVGDGANALGALGDVSATTLTIDSAPSLSVQGAVVAAGGDVRLVAATLDVAAGGSVTATNHRAQFQADQFGNAGSISASTIEVAPLVNGGTLLASSLGAVTATRVTLGTISGAGVLAGSIEITAGFDAHGSTLDLRSSGTVSQAAGAVIQAQRLIGSAGAVSLTNAANQISILGGFTVASGGTFDLQAAAPLDVVGPVDDPLGHVVLQADTVTLTSNGGTDIVTTPTLSIIPNLATGTVTFSSNATLAVATLEVGGSGGVALSGSVSLGALTYTGGTLSLLSNGTIGQTAPLNLGASTTLTANGGAVQLGDNGNAVSLLGASNASAGSFLLAGSSPVTIQGLVHARDTLTLRNGSGITIAGTLTADTVSLVTAATLPNLATVTELAGSAIIARALTATASHGDIDLDAGSNVVSVLAGVSVGNGAFVLSDTASLDIQGGISASLGVILHSTATTATAISETLGTLTTGTLSATSAVGDIALTGAGNVIGAVATLTAPGTVALTDAAPTLDVLGQVGASTVRLLVAGLDATGPAARIGNGGLVEIAPSSGVLGLGDGAPGSRISSAALAAVRAGTLRLGQVAGVTSASGIVLSGVVAPPSTVLDLQTTGDVVETGGATAGTLQLAGGTLTGSAASVTLDQTNTLGTLGAFTTANGFLLDATGSVAVDGAVTSTTNGITLALGGGFTLAATGSLQAPTVDLTASGSSTADAGATIVAGTLQNSGAASGSWDLTHDTNTIGSLGAFNSPDLTVSLTNSQLLHVAGPLRLRNLALDAPTIDFAGAVTIGNTLSVTAHAGGVAQSGGTISAGSLTGTSDTTASFLRAGNAITGLGAFQATRFALNDAVSLSVTGRVDVGAGTIDLTSAGAGETVGGFLVAGTLVSSTGTASGTLDLGNTLNAIDVLGTFSTNGATLILTDGSPLTVAGDFSGGALVLSAPSLAIDANITVSSLGLVARTGDVTEAGAINVATLSASAVTGNVLLTNVGNSIGTVSDMTALGTVALSDAIAPTVAGQVTADTVRLLVPGLDANGGAINATTVVEIAPLTAGTPMLLGAATASAGITTAALQAVHAPTLRLGAAGGVVRASSLTIAAALPLSVSTLDLQALTAITEVGGSFAIGTGTLTGQAPSVDLGGPNTLGVLGPFVATNFTLTDVGSLVLPATLNLATLALTADTLTISGQVTADTVALTGTGGATAGPVVVLGSQSRIRANTSLSLAAPNAGSGALAIEEMAGASVRAATLTVPASVGTVDLRQGADTIDVVNGVTLAGNLLLDDTTALTLRGTVAATNMTLVAPGITFDGTLTTGVADISTTSAGVTETANGVLTAGTLTSGGNVVGGVTLTAGRNAIANFGAILTGASRFDVVDTVPTATFTAGIAGAGITFVNAGSVVIADGALLSSPGRVSLTGIGIAEQGSGAIEAAVLIGAGLAGSGGVTPDVTLAGPNQVQALGNFTSAGRVTLVNATSLQASGNVTVATLALDAPTIGLSGTLRDATLDLTAGSGGVTQTTGTIVATTVTSSGGIGGSLVLASPSNTIASLGAMAVAQSIVLADQRDLALTGAVSAAVSAQFAISGVLSQAGGSLATARLTGAAASVALNGPGNAVGSVGDFDATNSLVLTTNGDLALTGTLTSASVALSTPGAIAQPSGVVVAGLLNVAADSVSLVQDNSITTLGDMTVAGPLTLVNAGDLQLAGVVDPTVFDLTIRHGSAHQVAGAITAGRLTSSGGISGDLVLNQDGNHIGAAGGIAVGGRLVLANAQDLQLDGNIDAAVLDLSVFGNVIQTAGSVSAGALSSASGITGDLTLGQGGNAIPALNGLNVDGTLTLNTNTGLALSNVSAGSATVQTGGDVAFTGDVVVPGRLSIAAGGQISRPGGNLAVGVLTGSAPTYADFGLNAAVSTLGPFTVFGDGAAPGATGTSRFRLFDGTALTLSGPLAADYIRVGAVGLLTWAGDISTAGLPRAQQDLVTPSDPGTVLSVTADGNGQARIDQTGVVHVRSQHGGLSTIRLQLPTSGGSIRFADLEAPTTDLLLFIGSGNATGQINVGNLLVMGRGGTAALFGTVRDLGGVGAARVSDIAPTPDTHYRVNNCPLQSVNCVLLPTEVLPLTSPLRDLAIGLGREDDDDADILLPNVSDRDY